MDTELLAEFRRYSPDELSELYKKDPTHFNDLAAAAISQACIGKTQEETLRLRRVQWFIDGQLRKAKTPLQRMVMMENIFYSRVFGADGELARLMVGCRELLTAAGALQRIPARKPVLLLLKGCRGN